MHACIVELTLCIRPAGPAFMEMTDRPTESTHDGCIVVGFFSSMCSLFFQVQPNQPLPAPYFAEHCHPTLSHHRHTDLCHLCCNSQVHEAQEHRLLQPSAGVQHPQRRSVLASTHLQPARHLDVQRSGAVMRCLATCLRCCNHACMQLSAHHAYPRTTLEGEMHWNTRALVFTGPHFCKLPGVMRRLVGD